MATAVKAIPQPLNGVEIKKGISVRMTQDLPADVTEELRSQILAGLGKTCSLMATSAYAKFKGTWELYWWRGKTEIFANWWVTFELDDFGRVTRGGIGDRRLSPPDDADCSDGVIVEVPPDKFRRETDQPIPKPTELKPPEPEKSTFSKSVRGPAKGRTV